MGLPNSANLYQQMQEAENKMNSYNLAGAPGNIGKAVRGAVRILQPQFQELGRAEAQAYKVPQQVMADYQQAQQSGAFQAPGIQGTEFTGTNPLARLGTALGRVGEQFGNIDALSQGIGFQKQRLEDIIGNIGRQYEAGYQQAQGQYNRLLPLFQAAMSREAAARRGGGGRRRGGINLIAPQRRGQGGGMSQWQALANEAANSGNEGAMYKVMQDWGQQEPDNPILQDYWDQWRAMKYGEGARNVAQEDLGDYLKGQVKGGMNVLSNLMPF